MKILLIAKTLTRGGAASGARNLLAALRAAGAEVTAVDAFAEQMGKPRRFIRVAERIYERLFHGAEIHCMRLGSPTFDLVELYERHRPDVIQLCDVSGNTIRFSDILRVPCPVIHRMSDFWPYHGADHYAIREPEHPGPADRLLRHLIFDKSSIPDCLVTPSHWLASCLGDQRTEVIRNAVAIHKHLNPRNAAKDVLRLGFISEPVLHPRKGFLSLPPFLSNLSQLAGIPVELHVFGSGPRAGLPYHAGFRIVAHPPFGPHDLEAVYDSFDILLCPSRQDNSPNVVTEALAHGVPVIAQRGTGIDSYINSEFGALVDFQIVNQDALNEFTDAVFRIFEDYYTYSQAANSFAQTELSPSIIGEKYLALYEELKPSVCR